VLAELFGLITSTAKNGNDYMREYSSLILYAELTNDATIEFDNVTISFNTSLVEQPDTSDSISVLTTMVP
jgi:hypothetical protein